MSGSESELGDHDFTEINEAAAELIYPINPVILRNRIFPINPYLDEQNMDSDNYTNPNLIYEEGEGLRVKPDPWCENNGQYSPMLFVGEDFDRSLEIGKNWLRFLKVPFSTLLLK